MKDLRVVFMGTPLFAVPILDSLIKNTNVLLVVCQPDKEKDKKGNIVFSEVKKLALENNIEVFQPTKIKEEYAKILEKEPDIIITCAYGQIVPDILLNYPKYKCINVHASLLPKLRGGAPIHWALINGLEETGVTVMYMDSKMDNGDIISSKSIPILKEDILDTLYFKLSILGRDLLMETLPNIISGNIKIMKQNEEEVTFGFNIKKEEEHIDFSKKSREVYNLVRGLNSDPGAYFIMNDLRVKVYEVEILEKEYQGEIGQIVDVLKHGFVVKTKDGAVLIKDIKIEGKKRIKTVDYLNGLKDKFSLMGIILK